MSSPPSPPEAGQAEATDCPHCRRQDARVRRAILGDCPDCVLALFEEPQVCSAHGPGARFAVRPPARSAAGTGG